MTKRSYELFTDEEKASWPPEHKKCRGCHEVLPFSNFHKKKQTLFGLMNDCKSCRKDVFKEKYYAMSREQKILKQVKERARVRKLPFDLELSDLKIPDKCPVFNQTFADKYPDDMYPTVDRVDPELGYVKGNIIFISDLANRIKSNASIWEVEQVLKYMKANCRNNRIRIPEMFAEHEEAPYDEKLEIMMNSIESALRDTSK